jgi:hypothetical protein
MTLSSSLQGKIIVLIDGVNRLMSDDINEAGLAWLPLEFSSNVRFILSATLPANSGSTLDAPSAVLGTLSIATYFQLLRLSSLKLTK